MSQDQNNKCVVRNYDKEKGNYVYTINEDKGVHSSSLLEFATDHRHPGSMSSVVMIEGLKPGKYSCILKPRNSIAHQSSTRFTIKDDKSILNTPPVFFQGKTPVEFSIIDESTGLNVTLNEGLKNIKIHVKCSVDDQDRYKEFYFDEGTGVLGYPTEVDSSKKYIGQIIDTIGGLFFIGSIIYLTIK